VISSAFEGINPSTRHNYLHGKKPQLAQGHKTVDVTAFSRPADNDMVQNLNFQELTGTNKVADHFNVSLNCVRFSPRSRIVVEIVTSKKAVTFVHPCKCIG